MVSELLGHSALRQDGHVCVQTAPGLSGLGAGTQLSSDSAPGTALWTTGSSLLCCRRNISGKPGRQNQKPLWSLTHLARCLSKPLLPRDLGPKVLLLAPAGRSEQVWGMETLLQQEDKTDKLRETSRDIPEISWATL